MRPKQLLVFVTFGIIAVGDLHAGLIIFTDVAPFRAAAGDLIEIDFETLPDGSPSVDAVQITPVFNYTDQGVDFFSHVPELFITGSPISAFNLKAGQQGSGGPRNWLIAELVTPRHGGGSIVSGEYYNFYL